MLRIIRGTRLGENEVNWIGAGGALNSFAVDAMAAVIRLLGP
jgi:hypothetical protein